MLLYVNVRIEKYNFFCFFRIQIKELYDELLNILDQLVEGKAEVYIARFIKKGSEKFDMVSIRYI